MMPLYANGSGGPREAQRGHGGPTIDIPGVPSARTSEKGHSRGAVLISGTHIQGVSERLFD